MSARVTFGRVLRSETIKLRTLRSTFWCSVVIVVLGVGFAALQALGFATLLSDPRLSGNVQSLDTKTLLLDCAVSGATLVSLVASVLGVLVISGEFGTGMIRSTFAAVPSRIPALLAKALVVAALTLVVSFVGTVLAALLAAPILGSAGVDVDFGSGELWAGIVGSAVSVALVTVFAFAIGAILRNTAGGIATALGVILVLPIVVGAIAAAANVDWLGNIAAFLPSNAGARLYAYGAFGDEVTAAQGSLSLNAWAGGGVLLGWVVVLVALGAILVRRRDV